MKTARFIVIKQLQRKILLCRMIQLTQYGARVLLGHPNYPLMQTWHCGALCSSYDTTLLSCHLVE